MVSICAKKSGFLISSCLGQYIGDIWMFDFRKLEYLQVPIQGVLSEAESTGLNQEQIFNRSEALK